MNPLKIPSPDEIIQQAKTTPLQEALAGSLVEILQNKFSWSSISVTLTEILWGVDKEKVWRPQSSDRDRLELIMQKAWWKMTYDGPGYNESYESYYKIGKKS